MSTLRQSLLGYRVVWERRRVFAAAELLALQKLANRHCWHHIWTVETPEATDGMPMLVTASTVIQPPKGSRWRPCRCRRQALEVFLQATYDRQHIFGICVRFTLLRIYRQCQLHEVVQFRISSKWRPCNPCERAMSTCGTILAKDDLASTAVVTA